MEWKVIALKHLSNNFFTIEDYKHFVGMLGDNVTFNEVIYDAVKNPYSENIIRLAVIPGIVLGYENVSRFWKAWPKNL